MDEKEEISKACSVLEARLLILTPPQAQTSLVPSLWTRQAYRNEHNISLGANHCGKNRVADTKDLFVESEVLVSDDRCDGAKLAQVCDSGKGWLHVVQFVG